MSLTFKVKQVWTQNIFIGHGTGPTWSVFEQSEKVLHPQGWFFFSDTHCTPCLLLDLPRHIIHVCLLSEKQLLLRENICVPDIALLCTTFLSCQILKHNSNCSQALCFYLIFRCASTSWFEVVIALVSQWVIDIFSDFRFSGNQVIQVMHKLHVVHVIHVIRIIPVVLVGKH